MNPFSSTTLPSASPLFRGRQAELARLKQICQDDVTAYRVIYGGHQNGKTSLLLQLEADLRVSVHVCTINFQRIPGATPSQVYAHIGQGIANVLPMGVSAAQIVDAPDLTAFLTQVLQRREIRRLVLLLDELGALPTATRAALGSALRALFQDRLNIPALAKLQIIFSGGIELYNLVVTDASSLHNVCEATYLEDLTRDEAVGLIADGLLAAGADHASAIGEMVYERVNGHPYLTQRIGGLLVEYTRRGEAIGPEQVAHVERQIGQYGDPLLRQIQNDMHEHQLESAVRLLLTTPPRFTRLDDAMTRLELIGLAKRDGERWAPRNPLLADVFREVLDVPAPVQTLAPARDDSAPATPVVPTATPVIPKASPVTPTATQPSPSSAASIKVNPPSPAVTTVGVRASWIPELIHIPAGPFLMGSSDTDTLADSDEKPQHRLELPDYWIGKTPVTNAQFRPFVQGDGYTNQTYWTAVGWQWREQEKIVTPYYWNEAKWNGDSYPVVGVSWFEAVAYCRWLSAQVGVEFRLPSEAEWEKAARGSDGRIWPWGNTWEDKRCNSAKGRFSVVRLFTGRTTPVDQYSNGASLYGVFDMAGNVRDWCATMQGKNYPYQMEDEWTEAYLAHDTARKTRGGDYSDGRKGVRGACRVNLTFARDRSYLFRGLRVASRSPMPGSGS